MRRPSHRDGDAADVPGRVPLAALEEAVDVRQPARPVAAAHALAARLDGLWARVEGGDSLAHSSVRRSPA